MSKNGYRLLRCLGVEPGMFSDERTITIRDRGARLREMFVQVADVDERRRAVRVKAYMYDGGRWALLPTAQPHSVPIWDGDLLPA